MKRFFVSSLLFPLLFACGASDSSPGSSGNGGAPASGGTGTGTGGTGTATGGTSGTGGATSTGGGTSTGGTGGGGAGGASGSGGGSTTAWMTANLTWYTSYPDPNSEECIEYNGCTWAGQFAAIDGVMPESWVMENNIAAVHSKDFPTYRLKTLRLRSGTHEIDVVVYDMCADSDCDGCCTANSSETGFLIDIESYTADRFGVRDGIVEWTCLDC